MTWAMMYGRTCLFAQRPAAHSPSGDGRIEVTARDVADGIRHRQHRQAEGERYPEKADAQDWETRREHRDFRSPQRPAKMYRKIRRQRAATYLAAWPCPLLVRAYFIERIDRSPSLLHPDEIRMFFARRPPPPGRRSAVSAAFIGFDRLRPASARYRTPASLQTRLRARTRSGTDRGERSITHD